MDFNFKLMSRQLVLKHASLDIALLKFVCNRFVLYVLNYLLKNIFIVGNVFLNLRVFLEILKIIINKGILELKDKNVMYYC